VQIDDERQTGAFARPEMTQLDGAGRPRDAQICDGRELRQLDIPGEARRGQLRARRRDRQGGRIGQVGRGPFAQDRGDLRVDLDDRVVAHGAFLHADLTMSAKLQQHRQCSSRLL
jgi:hypothetical protein